MISVIMSFFSEPINWLEMSIDSILKQNYRDFEFIIVCDNPKNIDAQIIIEKYMVRDKRIIFIKNDTNIGLTKSLNKGICASKGEYIARMDADDVAHVDRFSRQLEFLIANPDISVCCSDARVIDEDSNILASSKVHGQLIIEDLFQHSPIIHPTAMFKRNILNLRYPFYNEEFRYSQDYELWSFLYLNKVKFGIIRDTLIDYRVSKKQITKQHYEIQVKNSSRIGKLFYLKMLERVLENAENQTLEEQIDSLSKRIKHIPDDEKKMYLGLLYRQYYTISRTKKRYFLNYFKDPNCLIQKVPLRNTMYFLLSIFKVDRYNKFLLYY